MMQWISKFEKHPIYWQFSRKSGDKFRPKRTKKFINDDLKKGIFIKVLYKYNNLNNEKKRLIKKVVQKIFRF